MGERAVTVTAELADGWFPAYVTRDYFANWLPELEKIRRIDGKRDRPLTVISGPIIFVHEEELTARQSVANNLASYLCAMGDVYSKFVASQGYADEVVAVLQANPKPSPNDSSVPEEAQILLDQLTAYGSPAKVSAELKRWDDIVDVNILGISPGIAWEDIQAILIAGAPRTTAAE